MTHPTYIDALKFWASPPAMHLREHMGMFFPLMSVLSGQTAVARMPIDAVDEPAKGQRR